MLYYSQSRGEWTDDDGVVLVSGCYAGRDGGNHGDPLQNVRGKNNPAMQSVHDIGPLPQGQYTIGPLHTIPHLGPAMSLTPAPTNQMWGRLGFFFHLDNPAHPGQSSDGCIVAAGDPHGPLAGYQKQAIIEARRAVGEDQVTVQA